MTFNTAVGTPPSFSLHSDTDARSENLSQSPPSSDTGTVRFTSPSDWSFDTDDFDLRDRY